MKLKGFLWFLVGVIVTVGVFESAMRVQEQDECREWKEYEPYAELLGVVAQPWQREQCLRYGVKINY